MILQLALQLCVVVAHQEQDGYARYYEYHYGSSDKDLGFVLRRLSAPATADTTSSIRCAEVTIIKCPRAHHRSGSGQRSSYYAVCIAVAGIAFDVGLALAGA
jgi:hypothetical protein